MFGLSASHLLILGLVILIFGARRLPEVGAGLGQALKSFKDAVDGKNVAQNPKQIEHDEKGHSA